MPVHGEQRRSVTSSAWFSILTELVMADLGFLAVDGRSGSGKSTVAALLHRSVPASAIVHTDDVAWHHSFFDWSDLLVEGILKPLRNSRAVSYRPPGWDKRGRPGAIEIAAGLDLVVVEGVCANWTELIPGSTARCGYSPTLRKPNAAVSLGTAPPRRRKTSGASGAPRSLISYNGNGPGSEQRSS